MRETTKGFVSGPTGEVRFFLVAIRRSPQGPSIRNTKGRSVAPVCANSPSALPDCIPDSGVRFSIGHMRLHTTLSTGPSWGIYRVPALVPVCAPLCRGSISSDRLFCYPLAASIEAYYSPSLRISQTHSPGGSTRMPHGKPWNHQILVSLPCGSRGWRSAIGPWRHLGFV